METLVEAEKEMDLVHFEKRQLLAQWKSALLGITSREKALAAMKQAIHAQQEQDLSITNEMQRFKKDTIEQQVRYLLCVTRYVHCHVGTTWARVA